MTCGVPAGKDGLDLGRYTLAVFERADGHGPITTRLGSYEIVRRLAAAAWPSCSWRARSAPRASRSSSCSRGSCRSTRESPKFVRLFLDEARLVAQAGPPQHRAASTTSASATASTSSRWSTCTARTSRRSSASSHAHGARAADRARRAIVAAGRRRPALRARAARPRRHAPRHRPPRRLAVERASCRYDGGVKLVDFGVAKAATQHDEDAAPGRSRARSRTCRPSSARASAARSAQRRVLARRRAVGDGREPAGCPRAITTSRRSSRSSTTCRRRRRPAAECPPELEQIVAQALARDRGRTLPDRAGAAGRARGARAPPPALAVQGRAQRRAARTVRRRAQGLERRPASKPR